MTDIDKTLNILCYGDSNTWGHIPGSGNRYDRTERWTGILQKILGYEYHVIEEGLGGRTTNIDDLTRPGKNGETYLQPCLRSHLPLDVVIIMLGSNDLKTRFTRTANDIAIGVSSLVKIISDETESHLPIIIIVSPPKINESVMTEYKTDFAGGEIRYANLPALLNELALKTGSQFVDLSEQISPSNVDGLHLDKDAHQMIATLLAKKIKELCKS